MTTKLTRRVLLALACLLALGAPAPVEADPPQRRPPPHRVRKAPPRHKAVRQKPRQVRPRRATKLKRGRRKAHRARNRGALSTLRGIRVGKKYKLVNPTNGKVDPKARVVKTGVDPYSKVPYAWVRFSNGKEIQYAAERLNLNGRPRGFQLKYMRKQAKIISDAIARRLGVRNDDVRAITLRGRMSRAEKATAKDLEHKGPFLTALGEPLAPGEGVNGFYIEGRHTYVSRHFAAFDYTTRVHEKLHGMSIPFTDQADKKGYLNAMEGITDYLTFEVATPEFGVHEDPDNAYAMYVDFARQVATHIGKDRLKNIYFGKGKGLVDRLAREVDRAVGQKGAFHRAARRLERDEPANLPSPDQQRAAAGKR